MYFVGIDLAWSTKNGTGVSILSGDKDHAELIKTEVKYSDEDIIDFINDVVKDEEAILAIDAPLNSPK
jgi:predicted RNase H-like nuclease